MMFRQKFGPSGKIVLPSLVAKTVLPSLVALFLSAPAFAAPAVAPAGCNQLVWNALAAKAEAQVAYDAAVTREMIDKPDSVLTLTCFSDAAGVSAAKGGAIFSGDFTAQLQGVMAVTGGGNYNCSQINNLWNTIINEGVATNVPYATFDDFIANGAPPPGGGADFNAAWTAAKNANVFGTLATAVGQLQGPPSPPLDFSGTKSSCEVLVAAGVITGPCP